VSSADEEVMGMDLADEEKFVLFITKDGRGRKVKPSEFNELVNRGGKGYRIVETGKNRKLASFTLCEDTDAIVITTKSGRRISIMVSQVGAHLLKYIDIQKGDEVSTVSTVKQPAVTE
jgi:DNA gyrase subunit A